MKKIVIRGGIPLYGDVYISGMKNSALPILFATILSGGKNVLRNIPPVSDIALTLEILEWLGAKVERISDSMVIIDTESVKSKSAPDEFVSKMRGSSYLLGAMLGRFGTAGLGLPGGCDFGSRPLDLHIKGFQALGAEVSFENMIRVAAPHGLLGNHIYLDIASVGATINIIMASVLASGTTVIENAAREPHVVDLANYLNACGADISGAGTGTVKVRGVSELHPCTYTILPDMIEAGTYMVAAATAGGRVTVRNVIPKHLEAITAKLAETGIKLTIEDNDITVESNCRYRSTTVKTLPYPGFPTDMHPQFSAFFCYAEGMSSISEGIWSERFRYAAELQKLGASIEVPQEGTQNTAYINGQKRLQGAVNLHASDLRAGAALVIAALRADGVSEITGVELIERGYCNLAQNLRALGADIRMEEIP